MKPIKIKLVLLMLVAVPILIVTGNSYGARDTEAMNEIVTVINSDVTDISTESDVAEELVKLLCEIGDKIISQKRVYASDNEKEIMHNVHKALTNIGKPAVGSLVKELDNKNKTVRIAITDALGGIGPEALDAVPKLTEKLDDNDESVRISAARAIGNIGPNAKDAVKKLSEKMFDESGDVRRYSTEALGKIGPSSFTAVPVLVKKAMGDSYNNVRTEAANTLGRIGPKAISAVPALKVLVESGFKKSDEMKHRLALMAAKSLLQIDHENMEPANKLIDVIATNNWNWDYAFKLLEELGTCVETELRTALKSTTKESPGYIRLMNLLTKIDEKSGKKKLEKTLNKTGPKTDKKTWN